jgi:magnesium/cobalt transport protein CorA
MLSTYIVEFDLKTRGYQILSLEAFSISEKNLQKIYWIHCDLTKADHLNQIAKKINLPDEVIDLCRNESTMPRLIENNETVAIQVECLETAEHNKLSDILFSNLTLFLTSRYCFTAASKPLPTLVTFKDNFHKYLSFAKTPCFILFLLLDNTINDFSKLLLDFEILADQIDMQVEKSTKDLTYSKVMSTKKQVIKIQHHVAGIRDILMRISGRMITVISEACRLSLINLLDHTHIIFNEAEAIREILKNILDQIDNALMQRMNNTMKVLTTFAAVFLPLSLIAGIYGMNFYWIPELEWKYGYFWALFLMLVCGVGLVLLFKKMKWW